MHPLGGMQSARCLGGQAGLDFPTSCTWSMNLSLNLGHLPPWLGGCHKALWHNPGSLVSLQKQEQRGNPRAGSALTYYKLWLPVLPPCHHPVTIQPHHQTPTAPALTANHHRRRCLAISAADKEISFFILTASCSLSLLRGERCFLKRFFSLSCAFQ